MKRHVPEYVLWSGWIIVITLAVYLPALHGGFIWDDSLIIHNRMITAVDGVRRFWFTTQAPDYYPLTWTLWWVEWRLWGNSAMGYHVANVLLHVANAILVGALLKQLRVPGAWLAALVFAIHPVNVATAAWISEQKNTLSMLFYLTAIGLYLKFDEHNQWRWYSLSVASFLLALLSKTAVVMLPVVLLACLWWRRGRIQRKDCVRVVPFFALAVGLGWVTTWFQHNRVLGSHAVRTDGFPSRLAAAGWVPWFYLGKALWPFDLCVIYPKWPVDASWWVSYVPGIALVACLVLFWRKRNVGGRPLLFGVGYFVVTLFPVLGFIDQGFYGVSLVADHWQYYSIVGIIALTVAVGASICQQLGERRRYAGIVIGVTVVFALGTAAWSRSRVYADSRTLWQDTLARNPDAWLAHNNLGYLLAADGDLPDAAHHYEEALRLNPDYAAAHNNLGTVKLRTGHVQEAIGHFRRAMQIEPDWAAAHNNLGSALLQTGELSQAVTEFEQAIRYDPEYASAYYNLGNALYQEGRMTEAIECYRAAIRLGPDLAPAHNNLGSLLQADRLSEAIIQYERALDIEPDYAEAHFNLGNALVQSGQPGKAIAHYQQALQLRPDHADARYNLAVILADQGKYDEAISYIQAGLTREPSSERFQLLLDHVRRARAGQTGN